MPKTFLHVGCGSATKNSTTKAFAETQWHEVRLDIDPAVQPDIVGTTTDMSVVTSESVNALFSSHNLEHLYAHEVPLALREFLRVLKPDGFAVITCPDLRSVAELIAADKLTDAVYMSAAGPITPLDILYGHRASVAGGNHYMAHKCGFTKKVLGATLLEFGFRHAATMERGAPYFDLWAVATKSAMAEADIFELAAQHFPA
jgi:predicted SAM-dependent methyltransferase